MTAPEDRKALVEILVDGYMAARNGPDDLSAEECMERALDALEAAGCTVVPNEATEEMARKFWNQASDSDVRAGINAAIAHSPYRRK